MSKMAPTFFALSGLKGFGSEKPEFAKFRTPEMRAEFARNNPDFIKRQLERNPNVEFLDDPETTKGQKRRKIISSPNVTRGGVLVPQGAVQKKSLLG